MNQQKNKLVLLGKTSLATILMAALISYAVKDSGNTTPLLKVFLLSVAVLGAGFILLLLAIVPSAQFNQWTLRQGAKDTQWLFFNQDPPGFAQEKQAFLNQQVNNTNLAQKPS